MENEKLHRVSPFKEWLRDQKINEGLNSGTNVNPKYRQNNVYGFVEYNNLLQEAYCTLQFDHYNSVIDKCLNDLERDAPGLKYHSVMELAKKEVKGDDGEDYVDSTNNDHVLRTARNLFIYHIISDIKKRLNYDDTK
ncbi:MAG TPA: hypothetical protein DDX33_06015 [Rikenellaceae bacterium]|nr:hypothetical protein [Rikenellaceae bacterium]